MFFSTVDLRSAYLQVPINKKKINKPYPAFEAGGALYQFTRILFGIHNGVVSLQKNYVLLLESSPIVWETGVSIPG